MATGKKQPIDDVSKPGKTPADATARPIITGHSFMKDPMVTEDGKDKEPETVPDIADTAPTEKEIAAPSASKKVIQPLAADEPKAEAEAQKTDDAKTESTTPDEPTEEASEASVSDDAVVDAVLEQVGDKKQENKLSEEEEKRQELVDKLVQEKKYFVPIAHESAKRNSKLALIILAALLPLIIGLGLAADAGLVDLGFKVPFDFIKDKNAQQVVNTPAQPTTTQPTTEQKKVTPLSYENAEFGFGLTVPTALISSANTKEISLVALTDIPSTAGKVYTISGTQLVGGFVTKDWKPKTVSGSLPSFIGFTEYPACPKGTAQYTKVLFEDSTSCVSAHATKLAEGDSTYSLIVQKKLTNAKIAGLEFHSAEFNLPDYSQNGLEAALAKSTAYNQAVIDFVKSIKSL